MLKNVIDKDQKLKICEDILRDLPEWFGIEEALIDYTKDVQEMDFFSVYVEEKPVGFIAIKTHNNYTAEVYVMGILKTYHRQGIGKKLIQAGQTYCKNQNMTFITVKTLDGSRPNQAYDQTRDFYRSMGFKPLEVFKTLWDESNPCLFMAKVL
jgi:ribosomal protein S18 acetylase RimI-like enzyme